MQRLQVMNAMLGPASRQVRLCSGSEEAPVLSKEYAKAKLISLNRPKDLNSLNLDMVRIMQKLYTQWAQEPESFIVIKGVGRAFCAGGDVVAVAKGDNTMRRDFFMEEYKLNYMIKMFPRPHVALLDGIVMGGGVGLSVHGSHRIVTEKTMFAMPETGIGLFPDVGGSIFLPRLPYAGLGMYLALTGYRLVGADCLHANVGTHFVDSAKVAEVEEAIVNSTSQGVDAIIANFETPQKDLPAFTLQDQLNRIAKTFTLGSLDDIIADLESDNDEWAQKTLKTLSRMSPTALRITHEQLLRGERQDPEENFRMEARMVYGCMNVSGDFNEGVRALLVDKDKSPKWNPATLQETTKEYVSKFFEPRPDREWSPASA
eukprot:TRINITY_DN23361_c0_g1_i2.p1 TRINITY_DN23361_c0_g1~~TRINITY_DN23361_c0_g1_i2.p1  ORF type:complete len:373 (+),score=154.06 TRINITY_DN23361_c0_g1_i2:53-1171(+)